MRFCTTSDGVRIAYAALGQGPPLVKAGNWFGHLEYELKSPVWSHWIKEFSRYHLYVRYDRRGCGLSDWKVEDFSFDSQVRDLETVVDSIGLEKFVLLGYSQGGPVSIAYAVLHPERVSHLILFGTFDKGWAKRNFSEQDEENKAQIEAQMKLVKFGWAQDSPVYRQTFSSTFILNATPEQFRYLHDLQRVSTSPENATRIMREFGQIDVSDLLPRISVPTLVLHARGDLRVPFESGRRLAALIPGARIVQLESDNHILLESEPVWQKFLQEIRSFIGIKDEAGSAPDLSVAPSIVDSGAAVHEPEGPNIQVGIEVPAEVRVGDTFQLKLDLINTGKEPAILHSVEKLLPPGLRPAEPQATLSDEGIMEFRGKKLPPYQKESIRILVKSDPVEEIEVRPKVSYSDQKGNLQTNSSSSARIKVRASLEFKFKTDKTKLVFDYLVGAFAHDYMRERFPSDKSGWRSLVEIARETKSSTSAIYGDKVEWVRSSANLSKGGLPRQGSSPASAGGVAR